jgi:hypothetical protein
MLARLPGPPKANTRRAAPGRIPPVDRTDFGGQQRVDSSASPGRSGRVSSVGFRPPAGLPGDLGGEFAMIDEDQYNSAWRIDKARMMARPRKRTELEDCLKLDLNILRVQAIAQGEPTQQVVCCYPRYSGDARRFGLLVWRFSSATRGSMRLLVHSLDQSIDLVAAPRHFGGVQWYFLCPLTGRRASVLWMPQGESCFASRQAWGREVAYASQFITAPFRALSRAHDIRQLLGDQEYLRVFDPPPPSKPTWMHRDTYETLLNRLAFYERKCDLYVEQRIAHSNRV